MGEQGRTAGAGHRKTMMSILSREFMIYAQGGHEFPVLTEVETVEHFGFSADTIWTLASARIYRRKCLRDQLI